MQTVTHSDALSRFGCALSDPTRAEILLTLRGAPGYPSELAEKIGVRGRFCPTIWPVFVAAGW